MVPSSRRMAPPVPLDHSKFQGPWPSAAARAYAPFSRQAKMGRIRNTSALGPCRRARRTSGTPPLGTASTGKSLIQRGLNLSRTPKGAARRSTMRARRRPMEKRSMLDITRVASRCVLATLVAAAITATATAQELSPPPAPSAQKQKMIDLGVEHKTSRALYDYFKQQAKGGKALTWQTVPDWTGLWTREASPSPAFRRSASAPSASRSHDPPPGCAQSADNSPRPHIYSLTACCRKLSG